MLKRIVTNIIKLNKIGEVLKERIATDIQKYKNNYGQKDN